MAACTNPAPSPETLAARADRSYGTGVFGWLLSHRPAALVVLSPSPAEVRRIMLPAPVSPARRAPCSEAKARHAALLWAGVAWTPAARALLGCGVILYRDRGAVVVAPL